MTVRNTKANTRQLFSIFKYHKVSSYPKFSNASQIAAVSTF